MLIILLIWEVIDIEINKIYNDNCMEYMKEVNDSSFTLTLTDIPYGVVNRDSNGLRNLDKNIADVTTFDLNDFLNEVYRVTSGTIIIFCAKEQLSQIYKFFAEKQGTVRPVIWKKTNPSPMNGQFIYLSGVEVGVWFKKKGYKTFNAFCKNTVFEYSNGKRDIHPTQKNIELFKDLIVDNTNENDLVFEPCAGSFTTGIACRQLKRNCIGIELNTDYYKKALFRLNSYK